MMKVKCINEALRLIRVYHDISGTTLADHLNISPGYLSEIESGKKTPTIEFIITHAKFFDSQPSNTFKFAESLGYYKDLKTPLDRRRRLRLFNEHYLGFTE